MKQVLAELDPELLGALAGVRRSEAFARDLLNFVSLMKQNLVHPSALLLAAESSASPRLQSLAAVYQAYQQRLEAARMVDFRDLIMGAVSLLSSDARLLERLRSKFRRNGGRTSPTRTMASPCSPIASTATSFAMVPSG